MSTVELFLYVRPGQLQKFELAKIKDNRNMWLIIGLVILWIVGLIESQSRRGYSKSKQSDSKTSWNPPSELRTALNAKHADAIKELIEKKKAQLNIRYIDKLEKQHLTPEANGESTEEVEISRKIHRPNNFVVTNNPLSKLAKNEIRQVSREEEIKNFVKSRGIIHLLHFTQIDNIENILKHGLLGRLSLQSCAIKSKFNDLHRFDNVHNAISTSISFPNYKMFFSLQQKSPSTDWAIIKLKTSILWEIECAFNVTNAASSNIIAIPIEKRKEVISLKAMFDEHHESKTRANLQIPDNYTTDPQAEVLVLENIDPKYIDSIAFNEKLKISDLSKLLYLSRINIGSVQFVHDSSLFKPRMDYKFWIDNNKSGAFPNPFDNNRLRE